MILKFSIPAAISLLITAIYNIVDRILSVTSMALPPWLVYRCVFLSRI